MFLIGILVCICAFLLFWTGIDKGSYKRMIIAILMVVTFAAYYFELYVITKISIGLIGFLLLKIAREDLKSNKSLPKMTDEELHEELCKVDELLFYGPHEWVTKNTLRLRRTKLELENEINNRLQERKQNKTSK